MDAAQNYTVSASAIVQSELQQLLALLNSFTFLNLNSTEVRLAEGIKINMLLENRLDFYLREVDNLFYNRSRSFYFFMTRSPTPAAMITV